MAWSLCHTHICFHIVSTSKHANYACTTQKVPCRVVFNCVESLPLSLSLSHYLSHYLSVLWAHIHTHTRMNVISSPECIQNLPMPGHATKAQRVGRGWRTQLNSTHLISYRFVLVLKLNGYRVVRVVRVVVETLCACRHYCPADMSLCPTKSIGKRSQEK